MARALGAICQSVRVMEMADCSALPAFFTFSTELGLAYSTSCSMLRPVISVMSIYIRCVCETLYLHSHLQ